MIRSSLAFLLALAGIFAGHAVIDADKALDIKAPTVAGPTLTRANQALYGRKAGLPGF